MSVDTTTSNGPTEEESADSSPRLSNVEFDEILCEQIRNAKDKVAALHSAERELLARYVGRVKVATVKYYYKRLRLKAIGQNAELRVIPRIPYLPEMVALCKQVTEVERANVGRRFVRPARIDSPRLIKLAVDGVRDGMERKQVPQVLFCLNYLIGLRPNDLNPAFERRWTASASATTHVIVDALTNNEPLVGTLANLLPSKVKRGDDPTTRLHTTVFICPPADYPLMREALAFVFENGKRWPCTTKIRDYRSDVPCGGLRTGLEWGRSPSTGVNKAMLERLGFVETVEDWGSVRPNFTRALGRSFVASCVEQGIFEFGGDLRPFRAVELLLGHMQLSSNNINYLKLCCRPERYQGIKLHETTPEAPVVAGDKTVKYGVHLRPTSSSSSEEALVEASKRGP